MNNENPWPRPRARRWLQSTCIEWFADEVLSGLRSDRAGRAAVSRCVNGVLKDPSGPGGGLTPWELPDHQVVLQARTRPWPAAARCWLTRRTQAVSCRADPRVFGDAACRRRLGRSMATPPRSSSYLISRRWIRKITFTGLDSGRQHPPRWRTAHEARHMGIGRSLSSDRRGGRDIAFGVNAIAGSNSAMRGRCASQPTRSWSSRHRLPRSARALAKTCQGLEVGDGLEEGTPMAARQTAPPRLDGRASRAMPRTCAPPFSPAVTASATRGNFLAPTVVRRRASLTPGSFTTTLRAGAGTALSRRWTSHRRGANRCPPSAWRPTPSRGAQTADLLSRRSRRHACINIRQALGRDAFGASRPLAIRLAGGPEALYAYPATCVPWPS